MSKKLNEQPNQGSKRKDEGKRTSSCLTALILGMTVVIMIVALVLIVTSSFVQEILARQGISIDRTGIHKVPPTGYVQEEEIDINEPEEEPGETEIVEEKEPVSGVQATSNPVYRLYNPNTTDVLYTGNMSEIQTCCQDGWRIEGASWAAPLNSSTLVYRINNPAEGFYYTSSQELIDRMRMEGWSEPVPVWYSDDAQGVPVKCYYNPAGQGGHYRYTASADESKQLEAEGWSEQGVAFYGLATAGSNGNIVDLSLNKKDKLDTDNDGKSESFEVSAEKNEDGIYTYFRVKADSQIIDIVDVEADELAAYHVDINIYDAYQNILVVATKETKEAVVYVLAYDDNEIFQMGKIDASAGAIGLHSFNGDGSFETYQYSKYALNEKDFITYKGVHTVIDRELYEEPSEDLGVFNEEIGLQKSSGDDYFYMDESGFSEGVNGTMAVSTQLFLEPGGAQSAYISEGTNVYLKYVAFVNEGSAPVAYYFLISDGYDGWVRENDGLLQGMIVRE